MKWVIGFVSTVLVGMCILMTALSRDAAAVQTRMATLQRRLAALETLPMTSTWTSAGPTQQSLTTIQKDGESDADYLARHAARLATAQKLWPPIP